MQRNNAERNGTYGLGLSVNTVRRVREMLNATFNFAKEQDLIPDNPVKGTWVPPPPPSDVNPMTVGEAWAFSSVREMYWYGDALWFDLQTGLRPEELMALIWDDIDFGEGELRIERACKWENGRFTGFGPVKSLRSARKIELSEEHLDFLKARLEQQKEHIRSWTGAGKAYGEPMVAEWLKSAQKNYRHNYANTGLIFPARSGDVPNMDSPRKNFKAMLRRAGFPEKRLSIRWYDLRHTHATLLLTAGRPPHEVAARMGHTVDELNRTYAHVLPNRQRSASKLFLGLVPLDPPSSFTPEDVEQILRQVMSQANEEMMKSILRFS